MELGSSFPPNPVQHTQLSLSQAAINLSDKPAVTSGSERVFKCGGHVFHKIKIGVQFGLDYIKIGIRIILLLIFFVTRVRAMGCLLVKVGSDETQPKKTET